MSNINKYFNNIKGLIDKVENTQINNIEQAANVISDAIIKDKWIFAFGTGHSHMLAEELFYRAGGLVKVNPIFCTELMLHESAVKSSSMERLPGYAKIILSDYSISPGDVILIFSNSGRNAVPVEMAIEAKKLGAIIITITSLSHSSASSSRHHSGKRLYELSDIVIDNCGIVGDASISTKKCNVAPTSTVIGSMIINSIVARTAEIVESKEVSKFEFYSSSNTDIGEKENQAYLTKYKDQIKSL